MKFPPGLINFRVLLGETSGSGGPMLHRCLKTSIPNRLPRSFCCRYSEFSLGTHTARLFVREQKAARKCHFHALSSGSFFDLFVPMAELPASQWMASASHRALDSRLDRAKCHC